MLITRPLLLISFAFLLLILFEGTDAQGVCIHQGNRYRDGEEWVSEGRRNEGIRRRNAKKYSKTAKIRKKRTERWNNMVRRRRIIRTSANPKNHPGLLACRNICASI